MKIEKEAWAKLAKQPQWVQSLVLSLANENVVLRDRLNTADSYTEALKIDAGYIERKDQYTPIALADHAVFRMSSDPNRTHADSIEVSLRSLRGNKYGRRLVISGHSTISVQPQSANLINVFLDEYKGS